MEILIRRRILWCLSSSTSWLYPAPPSPPPPPPPHTHTHTAHTHKCFNELFCCIERGGINSVGHQILRCLIWIFTVCDGPFLLTYSAPIHVTWLIFRKLALPWHVTGHEAKKPVSIANLHDVTSAVRLYLNMSVSIPCADVGFICILPWLPGIIGRSCLSKQCRSRLNYSWGQFHPDLNCLPFCQNQVVKLNRLFYFFIYYLFILFFFFYYYFLFYLISTVKSKCVRIFWMTTVLHCYQ